MSHSRSLLHRENTESSRIVDLFAGPGGWSEGLAALGHSEVGIEWDEQACKTARAAGHTRVQADIALLSPVDVMRDHWPTPLRRSGYDPLDGLIASPPCQGWSLAGKGGGRRDKELCVRAALEIAAGYDRRAELITECEDPRSMLVVEPLRWALELRPRWIAMEQVPPVLEMWTLFADVLRQHGYSVWAGVLEAERYGVPQTRERAILMATMDGEVQPPRATHQRYIPGQGKRHDVTMDGEVLPWVSMADALGWGMTERPGLTFAPGTGNGGAAYEGGSGARATFHRERARGAWLDRRQGGAPRRSIEPAHTMSSQGLAKGRDVWIDKDDKTVRVTIDEAAAIQSFRPGYPWQGTQGQKFQQIGNAVPPGLAQPVLSVLIPTAEEVRLAV